MEITEKGEIQRVPEEERGPYLEGFLEDAGMLIRRGRYKQAVTFLRNPVVAKTLGFEFDEDSRSFLVPENPDEDGIKKLSASLAMNSGFDYGPNKTGKIKVADVYAVPPKPGERKREIPPEVWHEVALIHIEEWIHGLQHLKGKTLTDVEDREKDVAEYLLQKNVPMTKNFSQKHK